MAALDWSQCPVVDTENFIQRFQPNVTLLHSDLLVSLLQIHPGRRRNA